MKFCPKCQSFYDDESLAFCLADGIPLVKLNQSDELWSEGSNAVENSRQIHQKQIRRQKLKRFSRILITTVMIIMVISVIAMNIYIYTPPSEDEKVENITPTPTIEPSISPELLSTPNVISTPVSTITPLPNTTISPTPTKSPTPKLSPTVTNSPAICSPQKEEAIIRNFNISIWRKKILPEKPVVLEKYLKEHAVRAEADLGFVEQISVKVSSDCKTATVFVPYVWTILPTARAPFPVKGNRTFSCNKDGSWKC